MKKNTFKNKGYKRRFRSDAIEEPFSEQLLKNLFISYCEEHFTYY